MEPPTKVTQADIAREAGVSSFTVSQALRGQIGVSPDTMQRVKSVAERLGYSTNSAAALLARHRHRKDGAIPGQLTVARLVKQSHEEKFFQQACAAAGFEGRSFLVSEFSEAAAASRHLWQTGVNGLLVARDMLPWEGREIAQFDWSRFSVVKTQRDADRELRFHVVRHSPFDYMKMALEQVVARGYRRIAVLLFHSVSEHDNLARLGALLAFREKRLPGNAHLEWRELQCDTPGMGSINVGVAAWIRRFRPDVLLAYHWAMIYALQATGVWVPGKMGLAAVLATSEEIPGIPRIAGCDIQSREINRRAISLLGELILHGEKGFARQPREDVVEPVWRDGETLPLRKQRPFPLSRK